MAVDDTMGIVVLVEPGVGGSAAIIDVVTPNR